MADPQNNITDNDLSKIEQWRKILENANVAGSAQNKIWIDIHEQVLKSIKAVDGLKESTKNVYDLTDQLNKLKKQQTEITDTEADIYSNLNTQAKNYADQIKEGFKARRDQGELLGNAAKNQIELNELETQYNRGLINQQSYTNELNRLTAERNNIYNDINDASQKEADLQNVITGLANKQLGTLSASEQKQLLKYLNTVKESEQFKEYLKNHNINIQQLEDEIKLLKQQTSWYELLQQKVDNVSKKISKFKEIEGIKGTFSFFSAQLTTIGISFEGLLKNALAYETTITNAAKQLGISKDGVRALGASYAESASRATEINSNANAALMSTKNQLEAQSQINQSLGTAALFTEKQRIDQVVLTKQMGLTGEEAAKVFKLGLLNQKSAEETAKIIGAQVINLRKATGVNLDFKTVLNDVAKVSGQLAVQYKNNPDLLAKAVTQAKALGLELEQTAGMADKLLNFETSIEAELKAELLTGRALNLEQARYLALTGDSAGAAKELMNNVGGLSEFQKLNVIQQRSLAEAIGMSADELSRALVQQELLKGSAWSTQAAFEESVKNAKTEEERAQLLSQIKQASNADELMKQATQISNQEKFNAAIEKLQEMVGKMVDGPLGKMLDKFAAAVSNAETLKNIMTGISVLIAGSMISGIARFVGGLAAAVAPASATAAASMATASAITMGIGIVAVIAGLATAITALNSATGENISVATATGGGITPSEIPTTRTATPQSQPPIIVHSYLQSNGQTIQQWQDTTNMNSSTNKFA